MKKNKIINMVFYSMIITSAIFIFEQVFADSTFSTTTGSSSYPNNYSLMYGYSNQTESPLSGTTITVFTNKLSYVGKEFITISGSVYPVTDLKFVGMEIFNPDGILIHAEQPILKGGGKYNASFVSGGYKWNKIGTYTVKVFYGNAQSKTNFYFGVAGSLEMTMNDVKLMRSSEIMQLYDEINDLEQGKDFSLNYTYARSNLLSETNTINQAILDNEYYATFVGLSQIKENANIWLESPAKEKITTLADQLITSLQIETTPEFPAFVPLVLGVLMVIGLLHFKKRLNLH